MHLHNFDPHKAVERLASVGGIVIPRYLDEAFREQTLAKLHTLNYRRQVRIAGPAKVRQDYFDVPAAHRIGYLATLRDEVCGHLDERFRLLGACPFAGKLAFEEISVQKYEPGSTGIGSHQDFNPCKNLIALLVFTGTCTFVLSRTRGGRDEVFHVGPADLVLLRARGFLGDDGAKRPFHHIENIPQLRISVGFRDYPAKNP